LELFNKHTKYNYDDANILFGKGTGVVIVENGCNVFFSFTIFENKEQVLRNLPCAASKHRRNIKDGYFTNISGGMYLATGYFPMDYHVENWSLRYYSTRIAFGVLFQGFEGSAYGQDSLTSDGKITIGGYDINVPGIGKDYRFLLAKTINLIDGLDVILYDTGVNEIRGILPSLMFWEDIPRCYLDHKKHLSKDYKIIVGVDNDRYVAFSNVRRKYNISDDIFRLLYDYWLIEEINNVRQSLLSIN
jgi:hypothetical protein